MTVTRKYRFHKIRICVRPPGSRLRVCSRPRRHRQRDSTGAGEAEKGGLGSIHRHQRVSAFEHLVRARQEPRLRHRHDPHLRTVELLRQNARRLRWKTQGERFKLTSMGLWKGRWSVFLSANLMRIVYARISFQLCDWFFGEILSTQMTSLRFKRKWSVGGGVILPDS